MPILENQSAFPTPIVGMEGGVVGVEGGMTLRDYFASKALQGLLAADACMSRRWAEGVQDGYQQGGGNWMNPEGVTRKAYEIADAMIAARDFVKPPDAIQPIQILDLSVRGEHCLKLANISTIGDLMNKSEEELLGVRGFGKTTLRELRLKLRNRGLPELPQKKAGAQ